MIAERIETLLIAGRSSDQVCSAGASRDDVLAVLKARGWDLNSAGRLPHGKRVTTPAGLRNLPPGPLMEPARPPRPARRSLTAELEELERTDPTVAAAAACYDRMVERVTSKPLPEPRKEDPVPATAAPAEPSPPILSLHISEWYAADDIARITAAKKAAPAPVDLLARGLEHPSARVRKLARAAQDAVDELVTALLGAGR